MKAGLSLGLAQAARRERSLRKEDLVVTFLMRISHSKVLMSGWQLTRKTLWKATSNIKAFLCFIGC
ncbi:hypothetical protein POUND7_018355 [Theobroma cacao]